MRDAAEDPELPNVPDIILPSQFFQSAQARQFSSEQRLMLAVLTDAVNILRGWRGAGRSPARQIYNETTQWCFAPDNGAVFSFESVCGALRIDAAVLRRRLRADVRRGLARRGARGRLRLKEANRPQRVGFTDRRRHHAMRLGHREPSLG